MKFVKYLIFIILILFIGLAIYVGVQPNSYTVERSRSIPAPAAVIYNNVIDFRNWEAWSSWAEKDPDLKINYPEHTRGVGGSYSWEDQDGTGQMTTLSTQPDISIEQEMQFEDFAPSTVRWNFRSNDSGYTDVSWSMTSEKIPFMLKAYALFSGGFDKMIGPDFERGLEKLDSIVVSSMSQYSITVDGIKEYGGGFYLYMSTNADHSNIAEKMAENYHTISRFIEDNSIQQAGMPLTIYHERNIDNRTVIMSNGIPVQERIIVPKGNPVQCGYIPKTLALKATLKGNYTNLEEAWNTAMRYLGDNALEPSDIDPFEIYANDPGEFPNPADWITEIYVPLKEPAM